MKFGNNLKIIRKSKKISQEELAAKVGVSRQSVSKWETGEAYPEMNNILQLCKIFHCHINDLVDEDMSDIDSLGEEVKMKVVKFKKEQQKKMKGISKAIYILSRIGKVITTIGIIAASILMLVLPFTINNLKIKNNNIMFENNIIGTINDVDIEKFNNIYNNYNNIQIIIIGESICICLVISLILIYIILKELEKLFKNIHNGETPFTLENITSIKLIAKLLIAAILFPMITGSIAGLILKTDFDIEINAMDIILVLVIYSISYIFEYGYQIQKDSKGVMYDEK